MENFNTKSRKSPYTGTEDVQVRLLNKEADLKRIFDQRIPVPDEKVPWNVSWPDYKPTEYTEKTVLKMPPWADDPDP
jgi:hypothetical protein